MTLLNISDMFFMPELTFTWGNLSIYVVIPPSAGEITPDWHGINNIPVL